jgi:predicted component of type VI protein secretion system
MPWIDASECARLAPTAAEKAIAERDRLARQYRARRRAELKDLFNTEPHGKPLWKLHATLGHFGIGDARQMREYVQREVDSWLGAQPHDIRYEALRLIDSRIIRIRMNAGLVPFDDPLPGEPDKLFQQFKKMLCL